MESVQQQQQQQHHNLPRDSRPMDATESGNPSVQEVESVCPENLLQDAGAMRSRTVQTKGLFNFMELPAEIRVQIYNLLLICPATIDISSDRPVSCTAKAPSLSHPPISILQTCKQVNKEATPILYGKNCFTIRLPNDPSPTYLLSKFRWSTLRVLQSLTFTSTIGPLYTLPTSETAPSEPGFHCTGPDILARFTRADFRYSPVGPDHFMALSISNWVSTKVLSAQLSAIQKELELMGGPYDDVLAATGGPVT